MPRSARRSVGNPMTPDQIIAEEVGSTKAAIILAALREKGWKVVPMMPTAPGPGLRLYETFEWRPNTA